MITSSINLEVNDEEEMAILLEISTAKLIIGIPNDLIAHTIIYPTHSTYQTRERKEGGGLNNKRSKLQRGD